MERKNKCLPSRRGTFPGSPTLKHLPPERCEGAAGLLNSWARTAKVAQEDLNGSRSARDAGFHYKHLSSIATIGKSRAVVEIGRLRFRGLRAWSPAQGSGPSGEGGSAAKSAYHQNRS